MDPSATSYSLQQSDSQGSVNTENNQNIEAAGEEGFDPKLLEILQEENEGLKSKTSELETKHKETSQVLDRIKSAFSDGSDNIDPEDADKQFLDHYLEAALEAEKQGRPIPLTAQLAVKLVEEKKRSRSIEAKMSKLEQQLQAISDPNMGYDNKAYADIDMTMQQAFEDLYGEVNPELMKAAANMAIKEVQRLQKTAPEKWDRIRRNDNLKKNFGMYFVEKVIPPKARQILNAEKLKNTPMNRAEILAAHRETHSDKIDQATQAKLRSKIREEFWSNMMQTSRKK